MELLKELCQKYLEENSLKKVVKLIIEQCLKDYSFRTFLGAGGSLMSTFLFAVINAFLGIFLRSVWHGSICVYYMLLTVVRGMIILAEDRVYRKQVPDEALFREKTFYRSSVGLILMNLALIVPITILVRLKKPISMGLIPVIAMAAYTFYKLIVASYNFRKKNKSTNLFVRELRSVNMMDALLSIANLQNALITLKGTGETIQIVSAVTSAILLLQMIFISVWNLVSGRKELLKHHA